MTTLDTITLHVGHTVEVEVTPHVSNMISIALEMCTKGSTKVDAVRKIYPAIAELPRESIWYTIMHGVNLSSRGAVTYYYNMRREFSGSVIH